jgi:hypothetical protein
MTIHHLTDRMPEVRHGRDAWTTSDEAHLASCAECAVEWQVVGAVNVPAIEAVDSEVIAAAVLRRLDEFPILVFRQRRTAWRISVIGLAAAAALATVVLVRSPSPSTDAAFVPSREATMLPELDDLLEAELEQILALVEPMSTEPIGVIPRLGDLTEEELELLLLEVEG